MKKLFFLFTLLTMSFCCTYAQNDSVRIKLITSQGAEIGIDGDVSSTNIMTVRVPKGSHTVTVTSGTSYKKDYTIDVTGAQTSYEFLIDGKLSLTSQPSGADVYIDGMLRGRTPVTIDILGDHNLRIKKGEDTYYDYEQRVSMKPLQQLSYDAVLKKRPPHNYGMVLLNYIPISGTAGFGITGAYVRRFGVYVRLLSGDDSYGRSITSFSSNIVGPGIYKKDNNALICGHLGMMYRVNKHLYAYAGAGYGEFHTIMKKVGGGRDPIKMNEHEGVMVDFGVTAKWKALIAQVGYTRIVQKTDNIDPFGAIYIGVGITIHKQKKTY